MSFYIFFWQKLKIILFLHTVCLKIYCNVFLTLLHSEWPKLYRVLAILSAIVLSKDTVTFDQLGPGVCICQIAYLF